MAGGGGMRVYIVADDKGDGNLKCNGCGWRVSRLYALAKTKEEAEKLYRNGEAGLCAECLVELLMEKQDMS